MQCQSSALLHLIRDVGWLCGSSGQEYSFVYCTMSWYQNHVLAQLDLGKSIEYIAHNDELVFFSLRT